MSASRRYVPRNRADQIMADLVKRVAIALGVIVVVACIAVPIADAYESHQCEGSGVYPEQLRNYAIRTDTAPVCTDGRWEVITPRKDMPEDAYGWNCFLDGNGVCGPLAIIEDNCLTDPKDGYTMCQDGRVYYDGSGTTKLYPVVRNPS